MGGKANPEANLLKRQFIKGELEEIQIYFRRIPSAASTKNFGGLGSF